MQLLFYFQHGHFIASRLIETGRSQVRILLARQRKGLFNAAPFFSLVRLIHEDRHKADEIKHTHSTNMKYFFYILKSETLDKFYLGHTNNTDERLKKHQINNQIYFKTLTHTHYIV